MSGAVKTMTGPRFMQRFDRLEGRMILEVQKAGRRR